MAQRTIVRLQDDLDGSLADETVRFGLDGTSYEIDLSAEHAAALRTVFDRYRPAARKATPSGKTSHRTTVAPDPAAVRAWARSRNLTLPARGRLPRDIVEQFIAANS